MKVAVIGGDLRSVFCVKALLGRGVPVRCYALEKAEGLCCEASLEGALSGAERVLLPTPLCREPGLLNTPLSENRILLTALAEAVPKRAALIAGAVDEKTQALFQARGLTLQDSLLWEALARDNAALTAEGVLPVLIGSSPRSLWRSRALIVGCGRIGKALAERLHGLGCAPTVALRSERDRRFCEERGFPILDSRALAGALRGFDLVVNTVPAPVLGEKELTGLAPGTPVCELASAPGGIDRKAAEALSLRYCAAPGLPGKTAPETAALCLLEAMEANL